MWAVVSSQQTGKNENRMMCGDKKSEKNSEFQMVFIPTTFCALVSCSNH